MGDLRIETDGDVVTLTDPVRHESLELTVPGAVSATRVAPPDDVPVDAAISVTTDRFFVPRGNWTAVRDADGRLLTQFDYEVSTIVPDGPCTLETDGPLKGYVRVDAGLQITADAAADAIVCSLDRPTEVLVGGRLRRDHPRETITTTTDSRDLLEAVSHLSATLRTTTPERSFPSLRGHPPALRVGDSLEVPDHLSTPETGLELVVPPTVAHALTVAPLAYYLGTPVVPGEPPRLRHTDGTVLHRFDPDRFDEAVFDALRHLLTLDCAVRPEGNYPVECQLRRDVEAALSAVDVDVDFAALYDSPLAERTERYLAIPAAAVRDAAPRWPLGVVVEPSWEGIEAIPYLVDELAYVTVESPPAISGPGARQEALAVFLDPDPANPRSASEVFAGDASFSKLPSLPTDHTAYVGDHVPLSGGKFLADGARHRQRRATGAGPLSVTVVCNDPKMDDEAASTRAFYDVETTADVAVETAHDVSVAELAELVRERVDVLHFVGHATPAGLECRDGRLDVGELDEVRVSSFVLNACQSYRQGVRLVERGSVAGAVALSDVENEDAIAVGVSLARLLNVGFPFRTAVSLARQASVVGRQYLVVGDGGLTLAQPESLIPHLVTVEGRYGGQWRLSVDTFTTAASGLGGWFTPNTDACDAHYVNPGSTPTFELDTGELRAFLDDQVVPVVYESELRWSDEFDVAE